MKSNWRRIIGFTMAMLLGVGGSAVMAGEQGAVTAIAAMSNEASAFIGYQSGEVAFCGGHPYPCQFYEGTPDSPVTAMDTSQGSESRQYWVFVGYQNGDTYLCSFSFSRVCKRFDQKQ